MRRTPYFARTQPDATRRGLTLLEMLISGLLISTAIAMTLPTLKLIHSQDRAADQHQEAIAAVQNIMDDLMARDWEDLKSTTAESVTLPEALQQQLRDPELRVAIDAEDREDQPPARRIHVELSWQDLAGQRLPAVELVAWRYQPKGGS